MLERDALLTKLKGLDEEMEKVRAAGVNADNVDRLTHLLAETQSVEASLRRIQLAADVDQASREDAQAAQARAGRGETRTLSEFILDGDNLQRMTRGETLTYNRDIYTGANQGVAGAVEGVVPQIDPQIIARLRRPLDLLDLLSFGTTTSDSYVYFQQTGYTAAAAPVKRRTADGTNYPLANGPAKLTIVKKTAHVQKANVWARTDVDSLADQGQLESLIRDELLYDLRSELERQLFADAHQADSLPSLLADAQKTTYAAGADANEKALNKLLAVRHAKTMATLALQPADFVALDPVDREAIEVYRSTDGVFQTTALFGNGPTSVWGMPIVDSHALIGRGKIVVGSTRGFRGFTRKGVELTVSNNVGDDFLRDAVALKATTRNIGAVVRPENFVVVSQAATTTV